MTEKWIAENKLAVFAVVQEQHAERAQLYAQWKQFKWPILQDAFCEMGIKAVPMAIAVDEHGRVASHRVDEKWLTEWMEKDTVSEDKNESINTAETTIASDEFSKLVSEGDRLIKFPQKDADVDQAIEKYQAALRIRSDAPVHFRLGVALRKRFDLIGDEQDFRLAEQQWSTALEIDPNQYIFRRRIEQYGPRLNKPYPFYDWVEQAIADIKARGEMPVEQRVALSGSEIAGRVKDFGGVAGEIAAPDKEGKINRDDGLVSVSSIVVPGKIVPGNSARIHVSLEPNETAKWNNESSEPVIWVEAPEGVEVTHRLIKLEQPTDVTSKESRTTELEIKLPKDYSGKGSIPCYALYNVCKNDDGVCLYLRKDFEIQFEVKLK